MFSSEGREDQRDAGGTSVFRPLRRQNPFTDGGEICEKGYASAGVSVSYRLTGRFWSGVDDGI